MEKSRFVSLMSQDDYDTMAKDDFIEEQIARASSDSTSWLKWLEEDTSDLITNPFGTQWSSKKPRFGQWHCKK